jgi:histidinol-phosphate aminotransferase
MSVVSSPSLHVGENVSRLVPYQPGKPVEEVQRELGLTEVIKLASNENPLGPSLRAVQALRDAAEKVYLYPDGACYELRQSVASHLQIPQDHLIFGNGSDELIHYLGVTYLQPGDEVIQADPSFVRYEAAAILNGADCIKVPLKNWTHDLEAMADRITERTRLIFIANPNNPTGTIVTRREVEALLDRLPERVLLVLDEAYYEYVESHDYPRGVDYVRQGRNIILLRTFSKAYGLAGLRLGYGIARPQIIGHLNQVREPFNVNLIAQAAGAAAIADLEHVERSRQVNAVGKQTLYRAFESLGLEFTPTEGNFIWVDVGRNSREVFNALLRRGIIVRTGDIFGAPTHLRVTIGTPTQNEAFLNALEEVLKP